MTRLTNHHPSEALLMTFCEGSLSPGMSVAVTTHLDYCPECRRVAQEQQTLLATRWLSAEDAGQLPDPARFSGLVERITSSPQQVEPEAITRAQEPVELKVGNCRAILPRALARIAEQGVEWRSLGRGVRSANLRVDREQNCDFMYMEPGSRSIEHSHHGTEAMVVLDGSFSDELGEYGPGDFVWRDGQHTHTPETREGCICFAVLDKPLYFTSGWARLLNPLQRLFFSRQLRLNA